MDMAKYTTHMAAIVADVIEMGVDRDTIIRALGVKKSHLSLVEKGRSYFGDDKLPALAKLHGKVTSRELLRHKWNEWLKANKGVDLLSDAS